MIVEDSWRQLVAGNPTIVLQRKLKRLKAVLRSFNSHYYGELTSKVQVKAKELASVQLIDLSISLDPNAIELERKLSIELHELRKAEESFFRQKY